MPSIQSAGVLVENRDNRYSLGPISAQFKYAGLRFKQDPEMHRFDGREGGHLVHGHCFGVGSLVCQLCFPALVTDEIWEAPESRHGAPKGITQFGEQIVFPPVPITPPSGIGADRSRHWNNVWPTDGSITKDE